MSSKTKYSFSYRVYRKIRYLRYVRRLRKAERKAAAMAEKDALAVSRKLARDQLKAESSAEKGKREGRKSWKAGKQETRSDQIFSRILKKTGSIMKARPVKNRRTL